MTAALEGGEWSAARPGRTLSLGKTRYLFYRRLGGPQGRSGLAENLVPTGIRSQIVQPVVSRITDWASRPTKRNEYQEYFLEGKGDRSGWTENLVPTGIRFQIVQPEVSRNTDWASRPNKRNVYQEYILGVKATGA